MRLCRIWSGILLAWLAGITVFGATWEMPGVFGNAKDGWRPGCDNWSANPFADNGAYWTIFYSGMNNSTGFKPMKSGWAYRYYKVWRNPTESFSPETSLMEKTFKAYSHELKPGDVGPESAILFTPPRPGVYRIEIDGTMVKSPHAGICRIVLAVAGPNLETLRKIAGKQCSVGDSFAWKGELALKSGEGVAFLLRAVGTPSGNNDRFEFHHFTITEKNPPIASLPLPSKVSEWKPRSPEVTVKAGAPGELIFDVPAGTDTWAIVDGPEIALPERNRFASDRRLRISADVWPEKKAAYRCGGDYALKLRARRNDAQGQYTRSLCPIRSWDCALELEHVWKMHSWTQIQGISSMPPACTGLRFELWLAVPKTGRSVIHIRKLEALESFTVSHRILPKPGVTNHVFFENRGKMTVEFADANRIADWSVEVRDETGKLERRLAGKGAPSAVPVELGMGFHEIVAVSHDSGGREISTRTTAAVVGPALSDRVRTASRFGSNRVHGSLEFWKKSGCRWGWGPGSIILEDWILDPNGTIRPPAGWKPLVSPRDSAVILAARRFPKWLYGPEYKKDGGVYPPKNWELFERLFEAVGRANPQLRYFSPYNELNGCWRGTDDEFVRFFTAIVDGMKRGNPACEVSGPCDYAIDNKAFRKYLAKGIFDHLGGVNMHAYVNGTPPEGDFIDHVAEMCVDLKKSGHGDLPVYLTEFGWCSGTGDWQKTVSGLDRARYVVRSLALLTAQPVDGMAYFCFKWVGGAGLGGSPGYALLYDDGTPTASYAAFVNVVKNLSEVKKGDARWFRFSPRTNLILGKTSDHYIGVAWTTEGKEKFALPGIPLELCDMTGRPLKADSAEVELTPSPVFFKLPLDNSFYGMKELPEITARPGSAFSLPQPFFAGNSDIQVEGIHARVANSAGTGAYLLVGQFPGTKTWIGQPVRIPPLLKLQEVRCRCSDGCNRMEIDAVLQSLVEQEAELTFAFDSGKKIVRKVALSRRIPNTISLPAGKYRQGDRVKGKVTAKLCGSCPFQVEKEFDCSAIGSLLVVPGKGSKVDWSCLPGIDISSWHPSKTIAAADCSAILKTAVSRDGFHLLVTVNDDTFLQNCSPAGMWQEDSIQIAFDVDRSQPWKFNNIADGRYNGHRIFYYDICRTSDGHVLVWRNRADCPGLGCKCLVSGIRAEITRTGTRTVYDIALPWPMLGLKNAPAAGTELGFALAVNDADKGGDRHYLRFGNGITNGQDPEKFAILKICLPPDKNNLRR